MDTPQLLPIVSMCFRKSRVFAPYVILYHSTLGALCGLPTRQRATGFGFKSRTSYYESRNAVLQGTAADLLLTRTGPHTPSKRTKEVEARIIRTRFETAGTVTQMGSTVRARLVGQVLADYGLAKKKADTAPLPARLLAQEEIDILDSACTPHPRVVTRRDIEHDVTALLKRGCTTTSAGGFCFIPYLLQLGAGDLVTS